jgi:probable addiction module antidote protein
MATKKTKETLHTFDAARFLKNEEEMAAYLDACLEEAPEDATYLANALGTIARAHSMAQLAKDTGLGRESLYKALSSQGNPSLATVMKVAKALGLQLSFQSMKAAAAAKPAAPAGRKTPRTVPAAART